MSIAANLERYCGAVILRAMWPGRETASTNCCSVVGTCYKQVETKLVRS